MKSFAPLLLATAALLTHTSPASADDRVFLLQLGSFESRADAQGRWASLQETYPNLLEGLSVRLLDVTLPPDNFTVYRTQAGALSSRADAQIICERLNARGDECYVVETAMFQPQQMQSAAPAVAAIAAPQLNTPQLQMQAPAAPSVILPTVQQPSALPEQPAMQQQEVAIQPAPQAPSLNLGAGLEPLENESEQSFWSRLNPFSEGEAPSAAAPSVAASLPSALPEQPAIQMPAMQVAQAPSVADLRLLPPPPAAGAPRNDYVPPPPAPALLTPLGNVVPVEAMQAPIAVQPQTAYVPSPASAPQAASLPQNLPFQVKHNGQPVDSSQGMPQFIAAGDEVRVSEAVPVPVSQTQRMGPAPYSASQLRQLGMPSTQAAGKKTLWAEVQYFDSQQQALAFWDQFRAMNPAFPPARVRVTNPYLKASSNRPRISLRVGPFEYSDAVAAICAQVQGRDSKCHAVRDLGASATAGRQRSRGDSQRQLARYRSNASLQPMYWVQLGAFASPHKAHAVWETLRLRYAPLLESYKPSITTPASGSTLQTSYRLRTGPYAMRPQADSLCASLKAQGGQCLTIFAN